jgi:hypothetical protein
MNDTEWEGANKTVVVHFKVRRNWRRRGNSGHAVHRPSFEVLYACDAVRMMCEDVFRMRMDRAEDCFSKYCTSSVFGRIDWGNVEAAPVDPQSPYVKQSQQDTAQINGSTIRGTDTVDVFTRVCGILSTMDKYDTKALEHWSRGFEPFWDMHVRVSSALSFR